MKPLFWLASYPKSGNTWLRLLLNALTLAPGAALDINDLTESGGMASAREPFEHVTLLDSSLLTYEEIDGLRPRVYEALASQALDETSEEGRLPAHFVKVHDAYTATRRGEPLLGGARGAAGAILIVRDPRDVAPSFAHHNGVSIDDAIAMMGDAAFSYCGRRGRLHAQLRQRLLGWSGHARSWLDQPDLPVHVLRYEALHADAVRALDGVLRFAGLTYAPEALRRSAAAAAFSALQRLEGETGFREAPLHSQGVRFFRRGEVGAFRDELTAAQIARIEADHAPMMRRLGYLVSAGEH